MCGSSLLGSLNSDKTLAMSSVRATSLVVAISALVCGHRIAVAKADDLQNLTGPRGSRWGDPPQQVQRVEGRAPNNAITAADSCLQFSNVDIDGRKYEVSYRCFEKGGGLGSVGGWRPSRKAIALMGMTLQPFGPLRKIDDEFAWWEKELTGTYGEPSVHLDIPRSDDPKVIWPRWCPWVLQSLTWTSSDCPMDARFMRYRRWAGKKTIIELYDTGTGGLTTQDSQHVNVMFSQRAYFDTAEKSFEHATKAALKKQEDQAATQKHVPAF
jgi:hypothetical protein